MVSDNQIFIALLIAFVNGVFAVRYMEFGIPVW